MKDVEALESRVYLEDVLPIKDKMQEEMARGQRFVSFLSGEVPLRKEEFITFKSLFDAQEHAYENTTDIDKYTVRSIGVVINELDRVLNNPLFKQAIMDASVMSFNENQLKRVGMAEAFTPELQQKMQEKQPLIQHSFKKEYDGDKVEATLHLRKSATSDHYFLNKFDLSLQKEGSDTTVKQTFYIGARKQTENEDAGKQTAKVDQKYTLKEAYNLLAGRPVDKLQVSREGEQYQAWEKLNLNKVLANGNHEIKRYTQNYGFDLSQTMANYSIKELLNDSYKDSLETSLRRGNLQKATFVDWNGKEEKLYVSPNITLGTMNVYELEKKPLSIDKQLEKGYIKPEFAEQLKERIQNINQKQQTENNKQSIASNIVDPHSLNENAKLTQKAMYLNNNGEKKQKIKKEVVAKEQKVKKPSQRQKKR